MAKNFFDYVNTSSTPSYIIGGTGGSGGSVSLSSDSALCLNDIICSIVKGFDKEAQFESMQEEINNLRNQLQNCNKPIRSANTLGIMTLDTNVNVVIGFEYTRYISKYGIPEDGLFLPSLLAECI
jgi:hypothetical protein